MTAEQQTLTGDARRGLDDERRGLLFDLALALTAVIGVALAGVAIQRELAGSSSAPVGPGAAVARVERAQGNVKRRGADGLVWDVVGVGDGIGRGDGLFVPAGAIADVVFDDGSVLTVAPSSLVVIDAPPSSAATVSLRQGGVVVAPGQRGVDVHSGGARTAVTAASIAALTLEGDGSARVDVTRGEATINPASGEPLQLREPGAAVASPRGVRRLESRAALVSPAAGARRFFSGAPRAVSFAWRTTVPEVVFELADDRAFERLLLGRPASGGTAEVGDLSPGAYFWRVRGRDGSWASEGRPLLVVRDMPPEPITPARGQLVYAPDAATGFRWSEVPGVSRYLLQIAGDPSFAKPVVEQAVGGTQVRLASFAPEGVYRWRVRALDPERGTSPFSAPAAFRLVLEPLPAAPELYDPQLELEGSTALPPSVAAPAPTPATPPSAAPVPAPSPAPATAPAPATSPAPAAAPPAAGGTQGAARQALGPTGMLAWAWRLVGGVALAVEPVLQPPATGVSVLLRWSAVPGVATYVIEIAEDPDFRRVPVHERIGQPWFRWRPPSGDRYWWRVRSIDTRGREGLFSAARPVSASTTLGPSGPSPVAAPTAGTVAATGSPAPAPGSAIARASTSSPAPAVAAAVVSFAPAPQPPATLGGTVLAGEVLQPEVVSPLALQPAPAERKESLLGLGLQVGGGFALLRNAQGQASPSAALELACPLSTLAPRLGAMAPGLRAMLRAGYHEQHVSTQGPPTASATQNAIPIAVGARLVGAAGRVTPYLSGAALVGILHAELRAAGQPLLSATRVAVGLEGGGGIEARTTMGAIYLEARFAWLRQSSGGMELDGGGLATAVGYRLWL